METRTTISDEQFPANHAYRFPASTGRDAQYYTVSRLEHLLAAPATCWVGLWTDEHMPRSFIRLDHAEQFAREFSALNGDIRCAVIERDWRQGGPGRVVVEVGTERMALVSEYGFGVGIRVLTEAEDHA